MASVAATVATDPSSSAVPVPGTGQGSATLPQTTGPYLKEMMREVVTSGTAAGYFRAVLVIAKTGTADVQNQGKPNSWR